jgi:hypothetical protein
VGREDGTTGRREREREGGKGTHIEILTRENDDLVELG